MKLYRLTVLIVAVSLNLLLVNAYAATLNLIKPDNPLLRYTGRVDFSKKNAPVITWPGTSIQAAFSGTTLQLTLDDEFGNNYFNVIVDNEVYHPYVLKAKQGEHSYLVSSALNDGLHHLELVKRTEGEEGATTFKGIHITGSLHPLPSRPIRRIEIYGDSITSGMGNEAADNARDDLASEKNNYWAYGSIAARELNAELHTISQSGIGVMVSWFPFTMPQFYDQLNAVGNNDSSWNFTAWVPDLVVINLLQNDSWLIDNEKKLQPPPNDQQRIQAYVDFVRLIRLKYPKAQIICALGSMDATAKPKWPNYIRQAVTQMQTQFDDKRLHTVFFDFTGYGQHPRVAQHKANAKKLVNEARKIMKW